MDKWDYAGCKTKHCNDLSPKPARAEQVTDLVHLYRMDADGLPQLASTLLQRPETGRSCEHEVTFKAGRMPEHRAQLLRRARVVETEELPVQEAAERHAR